eukprot:TRINITY_DN19373_c0_g1_i1.p1 TRINITY_DN19373_c0_g1~~TRINITY_DN19373_c0_g1_i1.p1  ORF type:complete len:311 (+),score=56.50 TRINITY_DN19373_c0_g1_i1:78-1010(+)
MLQQETHTTHEKYNLSPGVVNWAAGTASGLACAVVGHPFDTVKVRLQTQPTERPMYNGVLDCLKKTWGQEGMGGFYKGIGSPLVGQLILRAWQFMSYGYAKRLIAGTEDINKIDKKLFFACGTATGVAIAPVECSMDLFKSQMQVQKVKETTIPGYKNPYKNVFHCCYRISIDRGLRGWGQGLSATLMRNSCSAGMYFGSYESARRYLADGEDVSKMSTAKQLIAGSIGGLGYWSLTFPLDSVKSSMQSDHTNPSQRRYSSWFDCVSKLYAEGGISRFYKGYVPCIARSLPANASLFTTYQLSANWLREL